MLGGTLSSQLAQWYRVLQALMRMGKHAEALGETRSLTVEGESAAAEVLAVRAEALYGSGNMERAMKMYEEVHYPLPHSGAA